MQNKLHLLAIWFISVGFVGFSTGRYHDPNNANAAKGDWDEVKINESFKEFMDRIKPELAKSETNVDTDDLYQAWLKNETDALIHQHQKGYKGAAVPESKGSDAKGSAKGSTPKGSAKGSKPKGSAKGSKPKGSAKGSKPKGSAKGSKPKGSAKGSSKPKGSAKGSSKPKGSTKGSKPKGTAKASKGKGTKAKSSSKRS